METKNIFKSLAMAMLMPAMLLTTACSNDDFTANNDNNVTTAKQGYTLPVTVNVTREGDATMRATYTDNGNGTGSLGFSSGDKLLVQGYDNGFDKFAGILTWQSGGTFSGTITTENTSYTGTADDLLKNAPILQANLLPAGYDSKGFIKVSGSGYQMPISYDYTKAFALTKAEAVEQLSKEYADADSYSSGTGFALAPLGFILNFTITGLTPSTEVAVAFTNGTITTSGNVTTDGSGNATFAISTNTANIGSCTLTVGGNNIALPSTSLKAGNIYNITRSAASAATPTLSLTSPAVGQVIGDDGKNYAANATLPTGVTKVAMIAYVSGSNGLAIALADEGAMKWAPAVTTAAAHTPVFSNGTWKLPSQDQWKQMFKANGGNEGSCNGLNTTITTAGGATLQNDALYWSSSESNPGVSAYGVYLDSGSADWISGVESSPNPVRACLEF